MSAATATDRFELGTTISARPVQALVLDALRSQRARLLATMRTASERDWSTPSRCALWNVHELVLHVCGGNQAVTGELTGEREVVAENFDPRTTPNRFVELHAADPIADTLDRLERSSDALVRIVHQHAADGRDDQVLAVWGAPIDWRLLVTHIFWDAWLHERDILLPLGHTPDTGDAEARLAVAYGLFVAGVMAGFMSPPVETALVLDGTGGGTFGLHVDGADVRVVAETRSSASGAAQGNSLAVVDALSGRGPELAKVLDGPAEVVATLSHLRAFLLTPTG